MKLNSFNFGFSTGFVLAVGVIILGSAVKFLEVGTPLMQVLSSVYLGFRPTFLGIIYGILWAFLDGFVGGFLIAYIYNSLLRKEK